ncbi:MAG: hypothetical protein B6244_12340 [Candidatus Cloacimonetes bacterium 4572_55]|nr:MAG: hypothetical protein B6244_12340 [Candidatus Cloacimonetes bacterium 4572_55]
MEIKLRNSPEKILTLLLIVVACLVIFNSVGQMIRFLTGHGKIFGFVPLFHLNQEGNIPTWFSSGILFIAGALAGMIALIKGKMEDTYYLYWIGLCGVFIFLSADEAASIHETISEPLRKLNLGGLLYYTWIAPASILVFFMGLIYLKFFWSLPKRTKILFIISAALFLTGALVVESIGGYLDDQSGRDTPVYELFSGIEETLEMLGVSIFIYSLLDYMKIEFGNFRIRLISDKSDLDDG